MTSEFRSAYPRHYFLTPTPRRRSVFILMPFVGFDDVYMAIRAAATDIGLEPVRADDEFLTRTSMEKILRGIAESEVVVADMTGRNANVFYEVGIAHSVKDNVVLLAQDLSDLPFDLQHIDHLQYEPSAVGLQNLRDGLAAILQRLPQEEPIESAPLSRTEIDRLFKLAAEGWVETALVNVPRSVLRASSGGGNDRAAAAGEFMDSMFESWRRIDEAGLNAAEANDGEALRLLLAAVGMAISHAIGNSRNLPPEIGGQPHLLAIRSWCRWGAVALRNESWRALDELLNRRIEITDPEGSTFVSIPSFDLAFHPDACGTDANATASVLTRPDPIATRRFTGLEQFMQFHSGFLLAFAIAAVIQAEPQYPIWALDRASLEPIVRRLETDGDFAAGFIGAAARRSVSEFNTVWDTSLRERLGTYGIETARRRRLRLARLPEHFALT